MNWNFLDPEYTPCTWQCEECDSEYYNEDKPQEYLGMMLCYDCAEQLYYEDKLEDDCA